MAVNYTDSVKVSRMTATRDFFAGGTLEVRTASDVVLAEFELSPSGGSVAGAGVWTIGFVSGSVTSLSSGVATNAVLKNSVGDVHLTGLTVGTSGSDIVLNTTDVVIGETFDLTAATITHA